MGWSNRTWTCPFFGWDDRTCVHCEGGRMDFPDRKAAAEYADRYCAHKSGWRECSVAASLLGYYERSTDAERKITVRNVEKIKDLKARLAEAQRYAARLETMCKGQDKQLMETQEGARELQRAMDGVLMAAALEHGEAVKNDQTGKTVGWRLRLPDIDAGRLAEQYLLHARKDLEKGGYVVSVVPRGQV